MVLCRVRSISDEYRWFSFTFRYCTRVAAVSRGREDCRCRDQRKKEERLEHRLRLDGLTGVLNKLAVQERIELCSTQVIPASCFVIDVDDFKLVNDSYGHWRATAHLRPSLGCFARSSIGAGLSVEWAGTSSRRSFCRTTGFPMLGKFRPLCAHKRRRSPLRWDSTWE